ncbi:Monoacylglycerol lipase [Actinidia chinensis var. chinensis]|uniref:Monoacylglycerol lipase n=1 Tax=Actinidia chinensis var. chinensis TaxID=1590841 RepID=A0A2R6RDD4_ACTCC|nr:Monoacylglycerol lipase [Actinidia chinensis var. chinensis]
MTKSCMISFTALQDGRYRRSFRAAGLKSVITDLGDGTVVHCWVPKVHEPNRPNLLLIHGVGANAMWQWNSFIAPLSSEFNVYVPDLVFFGRSYSTRPDRTEIFQAQCVMKTMEAHGVRWMRVVGLSYGGFVAYSMAAQFPDAVERVVIAAAGVCMEESDLEKGMFKVRNVEEAIVILLPQTPDKLRRLMQLSFYKPIKIFPSCFLKDFIDVMCTEYLEERKELIIALHKDRKLSDLPKITQPTLIIWGEQDQVFPLELGNRLKRLLGENAKLEIIKKAGHAINKEKWKEFFKHLKSFVIDHPKLESNGNNRKAD